eukprot:GHVN01073316.1.p1 GENE.GHVN01073316.1~~GHVN01073316.1.p1  ORF type:complete len:132 (+),score=18.56 GHVN01073316.1:601-996(+)
MGSGGSPTVQRIKVATFNTESEGVIIVGSSSHRSEEAQEFVKTFRNPVFKLMGSSIKLLLVAEGAAHVYPRFGDTNEWDIAAADAILREAGGSLKQNSGGQPADVESDVQYGKKNLLNPYFIAWGDARKPE